MPQPLPAPIVPSASGLIDAQRLGHSDYLENQKRELMQRAGGLAAAGDMSGARNELYKGGEFGEARGISAEQRAATSHAQSMSSAKLEKALQAQGLLGRLAGSIQTPEQLETAKARLKAIGLDVGNVTMDQLPQLRDQALSVQEQLNNEMTKRKLDILQQKADAKGNGVSLPAELGGRIGLGDQFLREYEGIKKGVSKMGYADDVNLALGRGDAAGLWRRIETGREALVRNLTGAGMAQAEAENAAARYQISPTDRTETKLAKLDGLRRDLEATRAGAIAGKSGKLSLTPPGAGADDTAVPPDSMSDEDLLKSLGL